MIFLKLLSTANDFFRFDNENKLFNLLFFLVYKVMNIRYKGGLISCRPLVTNNFSSLSSSCNEMNA